MEHESKPKFRINWRLFNVLAKLFTVGVILWMCVNLLTGLIATPFNSLRAETAIDEDANRVCIFEANNANPHQLFADISSSGAWNFGDSDWKFSMGSEGSGARFKQYTGLCVEANALFDDHATIQLFQELDVKPQTIGDDGMQIWYTEFQDISMVLFTLDSVVQMIRCRLPSQNGFSIMEGIPITSQRESAESLLPRCDGVSQLGVRRNNLGGISSEVLEVDAQNKIDIRVFWKENGWEVRPIPNLAPRRGTRVNQLDTGAAKRTRSLTRLTFVTNTPGIELHRIDVALLATPNLREHYNEKHLETRHSNRPWPNCRCI